MKPGDPVLVRAIDRILASEVPMTLEQVATSVAHTVPMARRETVDRAVRIRTVNLRAEKRIRWTDDGFGLRVWGFVPRAGEYPEAEEPKLRIRASETEQGRAAAEVLRRAVLGALAAGIGKTEIGSIVSETMPRKYMVRHIGEGSE